MNNIVKVGNHKVIEDYIAAELSIRKEDAQKVFAYLVAAYPQNTKEFGCIYPDAYNEKGLEHEMGLMLGGGQYYVNLPKSIVMAAALVLDITLTNGAVLGVCSMLGIPVQVFYHMNQHNGEACLLREYLRRKVSDPKGYSHLTGKECVNNDLSCRFRNGEGICGMQENDIEKVIKHFREAKI